MLAEVEVVVLAVVVVDGVCFVGVRGCGRGWWSRIGWSRVLSTPPAWRHPTGFAGVSFATVAGLVVGWSLGCLLRCLLMVVVVVDGVGFVGVRGCGRGWWSRVWVVALPARGRRRCRLCVPQECSMSWVWLLAEVWVVLVAAAVVDGVCFVGVRGCGHGCWPRIGSW